MAKTNTTARNILESTATIPSAVGETRESVVEAVKTVDQRAAELYAETQVKSIIIRKLAAEGFKTNPIAKALSKVYGKDVRYQHVYNTLHQVVKGA